MRGQMDKWLDSRKEFVDYHYFKLKLHDSGLEALKQGKIPNSGRNLQEEKGDNG